MKMTKLTVYEEFEAFYNKAYSFLMQKEAENNLALGLLNQIAESNKYENPLFILVENGSELEGVLLMTPPHHLIVSFRNGFEDFAETSRQLKEITEQHSIEIPGFIGEKNAAKRFAEIWTSGENSSPVVHMRQRIYRLDEVNDIPMSNGKFVQAEDKHKDLIANWLLGFIEDTPERPIPLEDAKKRASEMLDENSIYLWEVDGEPVSMARSARRTDNGITVNLVYTPKEHRKKGYASSVVTELSRLLLQDFDFCTLYTDLDNPTSNKIYMDIGYKPIIDSIMINV
jgi:uncharacterized protein